MTVDRVLPTAEGAELVGLVREIAAEELAPRAAAAEAAGEFPREAFALLGEAGVLGMPYPGGAGRVRPAVRGVSAGAGGDRGRVDERRRRCRGARPQLPRAAPVRHARPAGRPAGPDAGGDLLGAYALSEAQAGSDITGISTRAKIADEGYSLSGAKAWITHGSRADYYTTFARTSDDRTRGLSCFVVPADAPGLSFGRTGAEDGADRLDHHRALPRCRAGRRAPAGRRRGAGDADRPGRAGLRSVGDRRLCDRSRAGRPRRGRGLRPAARAVRQRDRGVPGHPVPAGRHGGRRRRRPGDVPDGRPQEGRGSALHPRRRRGQAGRHRRCDEGDHRRGAGAGRLRVHAGLPGRAVHARSEGDADLRGHQPDPEAGDRAVSCCADGGFARAGRGRVRSGRVRARRPIRCSGSPATIRPPGLRLVCCTAIHGRDPGPALDAGPSSVGSRGHAPLPRVARPVRCPVGRFSEPGRETGRLAGSGDGALDAPVGGRPAVGRIVRDGQSCSRGRGRRGRVAGGGRAHVGRVSVEVGAQVSTPTLPRWQYRVERRYLFRDRTLRSFVRRPGTEGLPPAGGSGSKLIVRKIFPVVAAGVGTADLAGAPSGTPCRARTSGSRWTAPAATCTTVAAPSVRCWKQGIEVGGHDVVAPARHPADRRDLDRRPVRRRVTVTVDGSTQIFWTTATTVEQALETQRIAIDGDDSPPAAARHRPRRLVVAVSTEKTVTLDDAGKKRRLTTNAATVGDALLDAGVTVDADDQVRPAATLPLPAVRRSATPGSTPAGDEEVEVAYDTTYKKSKKLDQGQTEVERKGVAGVRTTVVHRGASQRRAGQPEEDQLEGDHEAEGRVVLRGTKEVKSVLRGGRARRRRRRGRKPVADLHHRLHLLGQQPAGICPDRPADQIHDRAGGRRDLEGPDHRRGRAGRFDFGTRFYLPELKKYFIVEDLCGACSDGRNGGAYTLDVWVDGSDLSSGGAASCASRVTGCSRPSRTPVRPAGAIRLGLLTATRHRTGLDPAAMRVAGEPD